MARSAAIAVRPPTARAATRTCSTRPPIPTPPRRRFRESAYDAAVRKTRRATDAASSLPARLVGGARAHCGGCASSLCSAGSTSARTSGSQWPTCARSSSRSGTPTSRPTSRAATSCSRRSAGAKDLAALAQRRDPRGHRARRPGRRPHGRRARARRRGEPVHRRRPDEGRRRVPRRRRRPRRSRARRPLLLPAGRADDLRPRALRQRPERAGALEADGGVDEALAADDPHGAELAHGGRRLAEHDPLAAPAIGDRRAPVAAEGARAQLHARARPGVACTRRGRRARASSPRSPGRTAPRAPRASGRARRTPRGAGRAPRRAAATGRRAGPSRSSALGGRSIVVTGMSSRPARSFRCRESRQTSVL